MNKLIITILIILNLIVFYFINNKNNKNRVLHILHIGKTAGRALRTSLNGHKNIKVMRHAIVADDLDKCKNCDIAAVIREPVDRLLSAIYWFKQGGEFNEQRQNPCHKFVKNKTIAQILSNHQQFNFKCDVYNNTAFIPTTQYIKNYEGSIIPICYNRLNKDFNNIIRSYCNNKKCTLKTKNKSKRRKYDELNEQDKEAVNKYINSKYLNDVNFYNNNCRT
jgi:hypothetical protein